MSNGGKASPRVREERAQVELMRVRNTFSFRLGILLTESFVRKPWLMPLLPFRIIGLFFHKPPKPVDKGEPVRKPSNFDEMTILVFSTSEEGMASVERCVSITKDWLAEVGNKAIHVSSAEIASAANDSRVAMYTLPDPKGEVGLSTTEWNENCGNLLLNLIDSHKPGRLFFDGPYPYRGLLNAITLRAGLKTIWIRPATKVPDNEEQRSCFDEISLIWVNSDDVEAITVPSEVVPPSEIRGGSDRLRLLMGLGYDNRACKAKRMPAAFKELMRLPRMEVIIPAHSSLAQDGIGESTIERWTNITTNESLASLDAAIVPPEPHLVSHLIAQKIPTLVVSGPKISPSHLTSLRRESLDNPMLVLHDPDGEEIRLAIGNLIAGRMQALRVPPRMDVREKRRSWVDTLS